ncbi:Putative periplasmic protein [Rheinheimera sp. A13L]|uniref:transglutaminase-like cysteine peptidase n=1 Tax=Rheinheimera sp. A13L TaxID=506534 RepID=UPI000212530B|nr:transglutaminase-like cysteine peptidase [Rheinheimera sp. A13L]EGM78121.1 Putative periplasmic protein [Rheinheimera sp. A13L]
MLLKYVVVALLSFSVSLSGQTSYALQLFEPQILDTIRSTYGEAALARVERWRDLLEKGQSESDLVRLNKVNSFFNNQIRFKSDPEHWGQADYWATPLETLATAAGDCEDFAIAKYVSLRAMGVPDAKLRIMYVRALSVNEPHMVLIYMETDQSVPLVLDNIVKKVLPATRRPDLKPVYGFNAEGLWLAKAHGLGRKIEGKTGGSNWQELLNRIEKGM